MCVNFNSGCRNKAVKSRVRTTDCMKFFKAILFICPRSFCQKVDRHSSSKPKSHLRKINMSCVKYLMRFVFIGFYEISGKTHGLSPQLRQSVDRCFIQYFIGRCIFHRRRFCVGVKDVRPRFKHQLRHLQLNEI